ncbi:MAG: helix-turn-helix domain-containing protein [Aeromonas sp.]
MLAQWTQAQHGGRGVIPDKKKQAELLRSIGTRLREARAISNMQQQDAARHLGYATSARLSKIEQGGYAANMPLWVIVRAARLYDVSADYILGLSDNYGAAGDPEGREVHSWLMDTWEAHRERDLVVMRELCKRQQATAQAVKRTSAAILEAAAAMARFRELNTMFDDMRGGNRLVSALARAEAEAHGANRLLRHTAAAAPLVSVKN